MEQRVHHEFVTQNNYCFKNLIVLDLSFTYLKPQSFAFTFFLYF